MTETQRRKRRAVRATLRIPVIVIHRPEPTVIVREMTSAVSVSDIGIGFRLKQELEEGQLVELSLQLPRELRKFDPESEYYHVWGVIRHCDRVPDPNIEVHHIGVALIGARPPIAYERDPMALFELAGYGADGLWRVVETPGSVRRRRQPRYPIPVGVTVAKLDSANEPAETEDTVTENISIGGAAVFSTLVLNVGDIVKVTARQYNLTLSAEVRNVRVGTDGLPRIHLRFTDGQFPLEGIEQL